MAQSKRSRRKRPAKSTASTPSNFRQPSAVTSETKGSRAVSGRRGFASRSTEGLQTHGFPKAWLYGILAIVAMAIYAYWPTLVRMERAWRFEPDYSHGYLVLPLAGLLCWHRWDRFPGVMKRVSWVAVSLIVLSIVMRFAGRLAFATFLDGWSLLPLVAGVIWFLFGAPAMRWALPAIGFLFFMFPLPFQAETLMSWRLQGIATNLSTVFLRVLGQPAVYEGHVIWIDDQRLLVEQACSGLRIFIGVAALAYFWAAMADRGWIDRIILLVAVIPLAVTVNALRITVVGLLYQGFGDEGHRATIHDVSGYLMIPVAFFALWLVKEYWERLYRPLEQVTARDFLQSSASRAATT